jgi:hypothetical protein
MMFRARRAPRDLPDQVVRTAETLVRRAWALELARRCEREEFALRLERENCDTALALLVEAQRDGDPRRISVARAAAVQARDDVYAVAAARDQARKELRRELRLLTRKPKKLPATVGDGDRPRALPPAPSIRPPRHRGEGLRRLVRWRAADLPRR